MAVSTFKETLIRGDINEFTAKVDAHGEDITGMRVVMTAKRNRRDSFDEAVFSVSTDGGEIEITDGLLTDDEENYPDGYGVIAINIPPSATEDLETPLCLYADLEIKDGSNNPRTPLIGSFDLVLDITDG